MKRLGALFSGSRLSPSVLFSKPSDTSVVRGSHSGQGVSIVNLTSEHIAGGGVVRIQLSSKSVVVKLIVEE